MEHTDIAIIGAGPIGLELAVALKRAGLEYVHLDARQIGHTISWFAPGTRFFSSNERIAIAGVPLQTPEQGKATREQYLAYLRQVVQQFDLKVRTHEPVTRIDRAAQFELTTQPGGGPTSASSAEPRKLLCDRLVLATGGTARPRRLGIPGEDLPHVSHYFQDPHEYFRRRVVIVGGRNSAVEAALRCYGIGSTVSLSYRHGALDAQSIKYWLLPEIHSLIESGRIAGYFSTRPVRITPADITLEDESGRTIVVPADVVLLLVGYEADMTLCRMAGVEMASAGDVPRFDPQTMQSNVPGLYLAGTAVAGTQARFKVFIENCHVHVDRIVAAMTGQPPPPDRTAPAKPES